MPAANKMYIVDDEESIRNALERILRKWKAQTGLETKHFDSAAAALESLEREPERVRLILSDQRMPGMDGMEFLKIVNGRYPEVVSLLMSGNIDLETLRASKPAAVLAVLGKPWDASALLDVLDKANTRYDAG